MTVRFIGYQAYARELLAIAGLVDPEVEALVEQQVALDRKMDRLARFFGAANA